MDTTEARYSEMARLMVETGNWLTPQFDYGVPFWGKPPLFTWMSAAGIELFGVTEFAVRFPHWLAALLVILLMASFARKLGFSGLKTSVLITTSGIFLWSTGAVMTDMVLTLGMVLAMTGFYRCWQGELAWGYIGFIGLSVGLLAKGPLIIVLAGLAVVPWLVLQHGIKKSLVVLWLRFPIVSGVLLMLVIALPWYLMAEQATPGFLSYFIIGEHFNRFMVSDWAGDLYGDAHEHTRGMIWFFWLLAGLPWSVVLLVLFWYRRHWFRHPERYVLREKDGPIISFLLLWMLAPLMLFSFAGNILPTYVLPGVPAMAQLVVILLPGGFARSLWVPALASIVPVLILACHLVLLGDRSERWSDKVLIEKTNDKDPVYYLGSRPFSGRFYSHGRAGILADARSATNVAGSFQLIGRGAQVTQLITHENLHCQLQYMAQSGRALYHCGYGL
ncbi:glycosyltransferase family 39 protein [Endozoicomonas sp. SCSIO W0465]|uniref:ArnT family glycosyltransferase n=1 Tax=Endozoicomonas sp. SCSIO W0465 TaxID=2918516 RepID=UPI002075C885|nr:glycosyltransferase family 39 protein [Endozoicomonas sp. SCSIO W0465]USE34514.1 glycosyltransferase family 39 protein [Endozoicomonas sp. SCSIO W0465]